MNGSLRQYVYAAVTGCLSKSWNEKGYSKKHVTCHFHNFLKIGKISIYTSDIKTLLLITIPTFSALTRLHLPHKAIYINNINMFNFIGCSLGMFTPGLHLWTHIDTI